jgi:hypothetical protein
VGSEDGLTLGLGVVAEEAGVGEQVVQLVVGEVARCQSSNCSTKTWQIRLTLDLLRAACSPSASARVASTSRVESPRTKPAMTSDSRAMVRVTPRPSRREAKGSWLPFSFGRASVIGPDVVFTVIGA